MIKVMEELTIVGGMAVYGAIAGFIYWLMRFFRAYVSKKSWVDAVLDLLYYAAAGVLLALGLLRYTSGTLRIYAIVSYVFAAIISVRYVFLPINRAFNKISAYFVKKRSGR